MPEAAEVRRVVAALAAAEAARVVLMRQETILRRTPPPPEVREMARLVVPEAAQEILALQAVRELNGRLLARVVVAEVLTLLPVLEAQEVTMAVVAVVDQEPEVLEVLENRASL